MCLSVTTITKKIVDGFVPNLKEKGRFLGEREDQVRVYLQSVEGCGSNGQKLRKPATVYIFRIAVCSSLILGVSSVAKCWRQKPQISLSRGVVLSQSTFHLVHDWMIHCAAYTAAETSDAGPDNSPQMPLLVGDLEPPSNTWLFGKWNLDWFRRFAEHIHVTNTQTDRPRYVRHM